MRWAAMIRKLGGVALGIAIAVVVMMVAEAIGYRMFGFEMGPDQALPVPDTALPMGVQIAVVAGWFFGTLAGAYAAIWLSRTPWTAWAVAAAIIFGVILRLILSSTPLLMTAGGIAGPLIAAWLAQLLPSRRGSLA